MIYVFIALLVLGITIAMPAVIHLIIGQSDSMLGEAAQMIPLAVYIVWLCFAGDLSWQDCLGFSYESL